jgi:hypothetical protein
MLQAELAPRTPEAYAGDLAIFLSLCARRGLNGHTIERLSKTEALGSDTRR